VCIVWHDSRASLEGRQTHGVQLKFEFKNQDFGKLIFSKNKKVIQQTKFVDKASRFRHEWRGSMRCSNLAKNMLTQFF